jgi:hypothetical protein
MQAAAKKDLEGRPWLEKTLINLGAGMNTVVEGGKQIFGKEMSDDDIELNRALKDTAADSQTGGGLIQIVGEIGATSPLGLGGGSLVNAGIRKVAPKLASTLSAIGRAGGRIFNGRNVGAGIVQGTAQGALSPVTSDESRAENMAVGGTIGAVAPGVLALGAAGGKKLSTSAKNTLPRAVALIEKHLGPAEAARVRDVIARGGGNPNSLPLSTAAKTESEVLGALERGSRRRDASWAAQHDAPVADASWNWLRDATAKADDLKNLVANREEILQEGKGYLQRSDFPTDMRKANNDLVDNIEFLRTTPEARVYPEYNALLADVEAMSANPARTARDYASMWFRLQNEADRAVNPEVKTAIKQLQNYVGDAADTSSGGEFSAVLGRYKADQGAVNEAQAMKDIRGEFQTPEGVDRTTRSFDSPELTSSKLRGALANKGENEYGSLIGDQERRSLTELASELRRHEIYKGVNSPGATSVEQFDPMNVLATGRNNPIYLMPGLRGLVEATIGRGDKATLAAIDRALRNPDEYLRMLQAKDALGRPLTDQEKMIRSALLQSSRGAAAGSTGD